MNKCFGIISWLPNKQPDRQLREERLNRLFKQLETLWPDIDILIIAQNWKDFVPKHNNKLNIIKYDEGLGILKARKELRKEFLKLNYDYIIMLDDDAIIEYTDNKAPKKFMDMIDENPNKFCFIHSEAQKDYYIPYASAQLNLCAISKFIYEKEDIPDVDPQKMKPMKMGYMQHYYIISMLIMNLYLLNQYTAHNLIILKKLRQVLE